MKLPAFDYACPATVAEAVALLASRDDAKALAGGQSLVPMMAFRIASPSLLVDLRRLSDLRQITIDTGGVRLGAMVRWRDIEDDGRLDTVHPLLKAAVSHVAHYQIRNRGTVGGSIAHADPAAEMPGIAVTCDAEIAVMGTGGRRIIHADDFFIAPLTTALAVDEIITEIRLPAWPAQRRWGFREFSRRRGDFAMAAAAVFFDVDDAGRANNAHIGAIGVGDRPVRLRDAEAEVDGKVVDVAVSERAGRAASASVKPQSDIHASGAYRKSLIGTMVERALQSAAGQRFI
jgi:aerobic carbon-monoxide dehydrogenase medium subunit